MNGHTYERIDIDAAWSVAVDECEARAGHLVTITTAQENAFVWDNLYDGDKLWIGGSQPEGSGEPLGGWGWVTGEPWSYANWETDEPNDADQNEDCAEMWADVPGTWNDNTCTEDRHFVCEWDTPKAKAIPVAPFWALGGLGALLSAVAFLRMRRRKAGA